MRDHVLSLVSHDLRGPLNAIHSWAYVLERKLDANDPAAQRAIVGIRSGVDQQVKLLETIVDTTRAGTKTLALVREPFALQALFSDSADEVRAGLARSRGVSVAFESGLSTEQFNGDRERLAAALWLMLTFAVEASANGAKVTLASQRRRHAHGTPSSPSMRPWPHSTMLPCLICWNRSRAPRRARRAKRDGLRGCLRCASASRRPMAAPSSKARCRTAKLRRWRCTCRSSRLDELRR